MNSSDVFRNKTPQEEPQTEGPPRMTTSNAHVNANANALERSSPIPTDYPPSCIQIVTWYMSDSLSFTTLVNLLTKKPQYEQVRKLELVAPSGDVKDDLVDALCDYIETNKYLRDVHLYTIQSKHQRSSSAVTNQKEKAFIKHIEASCGHNVDCIIQEIPQNGEPNLLCESLTNTIHENVYRRHLAVDGILLQGISKSSLNQLAFDISWDRSIHVCVLKDFPNAILKAILPKLVHPPLQCLKIVNDPALADARKLPDAPSFNTLPLQYMLKSPKLKHLQRLYFGHVRFTPTNLPPILDALQAHSTRAIPELEFALCQFDRGTGKLFQDFHKACPHTSLRFHYPVFTNPSQTEEDSYLMSSLGSVFTIGSTSSLMKGEPQASPVPSTRKPSAIAKPKF